MYDFEMFKDEEILFMMDVLLKKENCDEVVSSIVTNKRFMLFDYPSKVNNYDEVLRVSRGVDYTLKKEIILEVSLNDIDSINTEVGYDKYVLKNGDYFFIKCDDLSKFVKNKKNII